MRTVWTSLVGIVLWVIASPALGGLVVTSYRTVALTNGYAPLSQTQYFAEQRLENITPALAEVFGDWMGPNAGGSTPTWHFVGTSRAASTTTITPDRYRVEAAASFAFQIDTTADFIDPRSGSILSPAGAANYRGFFQTDVPLNYAITANLNHLGRVRLNRIGGPEIFDEINVDASSQFLSLAGTISPGQYQFLATAGTGATNLPNGVNIYTQAGSFENLMFTVQVPEPSAVGAAMGLMTPIILTRRARSGGASEERNGDAASFLGRSRRGR